MKTFTKMALVGLVVLGCMSTQEMFGKCKNGSCSRKRAVVKTALVHRQQPKIDPIKPADNNTCKDGVCSRR